MHTASYEFLMKPKESAGCHQTLSARVGSGDETSIIPALFALHFGMPSLHLFTFLMLFFLNFLVLYRAGVKGMSDSPGVNDPPSHWLSDSPSNV